MMICKLGLRGALGIIVITCWQRVSGRGLCSQSAELRLLRSLMKRLEDGGYALGLCNEGHRLIFFLGQRSLFCVRAQAPLK